MANEILIKVHEAYRKVVAVCDAELIGKRFEQDERQLDIKKDFFEGDKKNEEEAIKILRNAQEDDATFNIIGKESVNAALKAGIISKKGVMKIQGVPFALSLL